MATPPMPLQNRVSVVTGATAGIGLAIAHELVRLGSFVVINGRREDKLRDLQSELGDEDAAIVLGDCSDDAVITQMLDTAREHGRGRGSDLFVLNAGRGLNGSVVSSDTGQWDEMIRTNILGCAKLLRAAALDLLRDLGDNAGPKALSRARDIVVLGSTVGRNVSPFSSMYGSTKFAVHGMAEGARRELGPKGIRVTLIEPGFVVSEFQGVAGYKQEWFEEVKGRIGPVLTPEDVARTVGFVVSQPPAVHVADVLIRPTRQDYP